MLIRVFSLNRISKTYLDFAEHANTMKSAPLWKSPCFKKAASVLCNVKWTARKDCILQINFEYVTLIRWKETNYSRRKTKQVGLLKQPNFYPNPIIKKSGSLQEIFPWSWQHILCLWLWKLRWQAWKSPCWARWFPGIFFGVLQW